MHLPSALSKDILTTFRRMYNFHAFFLLTIKSIFYLYQIASNYKKKQRKALTFDRYPAGGPIPQPSGNGGLAVDPKLMSNKSNR